MYKTKKELDAHVRTAFAKIRSETERNLRSFTIAKLYFKINEFSTAEQYLCYYLNVKDDNDQAHKLLGQCYQRLKKPDKALQHFQRSLQVNPKQPELLADVCQLLLTEKSLNSNNAKYWCELAESENIQHDAVFSLRLKLMDMDNMETNQVEALIQKEISSKPNDVYLRVRLLRYYVEQNQILNAFKYVHQLEMAQQDDLMTSNEWYNVVWLVLKKYEQMSNTKKDWEFWLIMAICLERQVQISSAMTLVVDGATETANLLFLLDQYLFKISQHSDKLCAQKELVELFLDHYRGQLLLHTCALIFKRELVQNKNKWKETVRVVLPLLLLAYQVDAPDPKAPWIKHCDEQGKYLISMWHREGSFRCAQAGRTLLSCLEDDTAGDKENCHVAGNLLSSHSSSLWSKCDDLLTQVRQICGDRDWRSNIFAQIFCNSDQKVKEHSSLLAKSQKLNEPRYELPSYADVERYEDSAQYLRPQSLQHMVYLCLGNANLAYVRAKYFNGLNFSAQNLSFCGAESLNQLDVDSFLYASTIQAKRALEMDRKAFNSYQLGNSSAAGRPIILPFVNLQHLLCTEEQSQWWNSAYLAYKNFSNRSDMAEIRGNLQCGIEAVRGINGPKMDMAIVFKLGQIFVLRAQDIVKPIEKAFLEARSESIYKYGLNMMKMHNKGVLEPFRKYFKYANAQTSAAEKAVAAAAEDAVSYLATRYFKKNEYEDLIEELAGIQLPFATYLQAEAYRKLDEASKTPKKVKRLYLDRASECLSQTLDLLKYGAHADPNHPLNSVIDNEIKRLQQASARYLNDSTSTTLSPITGHNNSSTYEDAEADFYAENNILPTPSALSNSSRSRRDNMAANAAYAQHSQDLENLVKKMSSTLSFLQENINETIKSEFRTVTKEISGIKEKIASLEETMKKIRVSSNPPSRDDAFNVLDDLYNIEESLQQQLYQQQQQQHQAPNQYGPGGVGSGPANIMPNSFMAHQQRLQVAAFNSPMYPPAPNYPMNFYGHGQPYTIMTPTNGPPPAVNQRPPGMPPLPYLDPTAPPCSMNFSLPPQSAPLLPAPTQPPNLGSTDTPRTPSNLYNLLQHPPVPITPHTGPASMPAFSSASLTHSMPPMQQSNVTSAALAPPQTPTTSMQQFHKITNQPVEKGPPANVVITSSDPLPNPNSLPAQSQQQAPLSVTIPSHHIKPSLVSQQQQQPEVFMSQNTALPPISLPATNKTSIANTTATSIFGSSSISSSTFSFKPHIAAAAAAAAQSNATTISPGKTSDNLNKTSDSLGSDFNKSTLEDVEYDPRPDFKPIIPLPDEIVVRTGEEDEEVVFCYRAKLYRHVDKDWKERGIGEIKILKNKEGTSRILMRREQTHKICANHLITPALILTVPKNEPKGFIWVANDFADEELRVEKFYLRFKMPETAKQFEVSFKNAQKESVEKGKLQDMKKTAAPFALTKSAATSFVTSTPAPKSGDTPVVKPVFGQLNTSSLASEAATVSSTTPTSKSLFTGLNLTTKAPPTNETTKASEGVSTTSPFANFTFGKTTGTSGTTPATMQSPFASIFTNLNKSTASPLSVSSITTTTSNVSPHVNDSTKATVVALNKSAASDNEEEYVPTAEFNPVIALPDLVEVNTGEENEDVLFEHRAKLLRFDKEVGEWKERGLGNIKLLREKEDYNKVRLLMRREQVHKICCNQRIYKDTQFKYAKNSQTALTWAGQDYSENELVTETLTVRFKLPDTCNQFLETMKSAQAKMTDDKEEKTAEKNVQSTNESQAPIKGFGNAFKPKTGSWSCKSCYISNASDNLHCVACDSPKDDTVPKKEANANILASSGKSTFSFGFQFAQVAPPTTTDASAKPTIGFGTAMKDGSSTSATTAAIITTSNTKATKPPNGTGFGDAFKPKAGSWTCQGCYVCNTGDAIYCTACDAPKDDTIPKKDSNTNVLALSNPTQKFSFGFGAASSGGASAVKPTSGFSFNSTPVTATDSSKSFTFAPPSATSTGLSSASEPVVNSALAKTPFNFSLSSKPIEAPTFPSTTTTTTGEATTNAFALDKKEFSFTMKPKSPGKIDRSPFKLPGAGGDVDGGANDDDGEYHEEEENNTYFVPVISLPDKIDVKTGEENEELLYIHRAKLYRFIRGEWKERGVGNLKILRHKETKKLRVVMRRDQVFKICLNHMLNEDVDYKRKDDKSWLFVVNDFSEGSVELEKFSLRFKSKDIAEAFINAVRKALDGSAEEIESPFNTSITTPTNINPSEPGPIISEEDKKMSNELKLPYEFFTIKSPCTGCRGCDPDKFVFDEIKSNDAFVSPEDTNNPLETMELPALSISKSNNRTILKQSTLLSPSAKAVESTNRNDTIFSGFGGTNLTALNNSVDKPAVNTTFSFAAALNSTTKPAEQIGSTAGSTGGFLFGSSSPGFFGSGSGENKSAFGNTKLFDNTSVTSNDTTTQADKTASKSIFGGTGGFGGISGGSIFGGKSSTSDTVVNTKSIFGSSNDSTQSGKIGLGNSVFGSQATNSSVLGGFGSGSNMFESNTTKDNNNSLSTPAFADLLNSSTAAIGFDSLAAKVNSSNSLLNNSTETSGPGGFIGLTNQNDFSSFSKSMSTAADTSIKDTSDANDPQTRTGGGAATDANENDENYDPHYEPIIELPDKIVVSTGEEEETKLFGERAILYRFDGTSKEWKERGVGELKILLHPAKQSYRMVMRREQIHKLVLNHCINVNFVFSNMFNNPKSLFWATMNYAESNEGVAEKLAVRFKNVELATVFSSKLQECIDNCKKRDNGN